jgi:hypothetical protein
MAYTTINKSGDYFNTSLWSGNGSAQTISGVGFQPDWLWTKCRSDSYSNILIDSVSGITKQLKSEGNAVEATNAPGVTDFNADGYVLGTQADFAVNGNTFVGWGWKANGAGSANTDGSINSTVSVNATSGFSIVKWTGTGANATIGHGLGAVPKMIITKALGATNSWGVYHASLGNNKYLYLDASQAALSATAMWNDTTPTSSVFSVGTSGASNASGAMIAYCFAEKTGYSKFGSYVGNGSTDGTFVYTGFKPAFIIVKRTDSATDWIMVDNKRAGYNSSNYRLYPNTSSAEDTGFNIDLMSNGFKNTKTNNAINASGGTYIYMAFGQSLVGTNNIPNNAR